MERTIKVTGKANLLVPADTTKIVLDLEGKASSYEETIKLSAKVLNNMKEELEKIGFDKKDIKSTNYHIDIHYESYKDIDGNYKRKQYGYEYEQTIKFTFLNDNKLLAKVLSTLANLVSAPSIHIYYIASNTEEVKNKLLEEAIIDATNKAKVIANASNVKLGDLVNVDYSYQEVEFVSRMCLDASSCMDSTSSDYEMDISPDDISCSDHVTILYEIR